MGPNHSSAIRALIAIAAVAVFLLPLPARGQTADQFFAGDRLDDVWIHINSRDWQTLRARFVENTFYPCDLEWRSVRVYNAGCRSRGSGSRTGIKPGLEIQFDRYVSGQRFLGLSQIVLDNMWQDPSMLHERLTMWLFRQAGLPAPRESSIRLFVGSGRDYAGVYTAVESIDPDFLERGFGEGSAYLYEYRWRDVYHFEDLGRELEPYSARLAPRTHEHESIAALYLPIRDLIDTINDAPLDRIAEVLDLPRLTTQLAVENFVADWDGLLGYAGLNNFYIARTPGRPAHVIPWDKDSAFFYLEMLPWHNVEFNVLARKVWEDPATLQDYLTTLLRLASLGTALEEELEREFAQIEAAALADPLKPGTNDDFHAAVAQVRQFAQRRPSIVRNYVRPLMR